VISEHAAAKINLFLHVGERRDDGFHPLQSLAVFTAMGDALQIEPAPVLSLKIQGPFAKGLEGEGDNLVLRAARALGSAQGAKLTLTKNLPVASGIGGGLGVVLTAVEESTSSTFMTCQPLGPRTPEHSTVAPGLRSSCPDCRSVVTCRNASLLSLSRAKNP